jgi:hypothetical protein
MEGAVSRVRGWLEARGPDMIGGRVKPAPQFRTMQPFGLHEDHVLHRPSCEVHLPDMVTFKCSLGALLAEPDHELAVHDADEHMPS